MSFLSSGQFMLLAFGIPSQTMGGLRTWIVCWGVVSLYLIGAWAQLIIFSVTEEKHAGILADDRCWKSSKQFPLLLPSAYRWQMCSSSLIMEYHFISWVKVTSGKRLRQMHPVPGSLGWILAFTGWGLNISYWIHIRGRKRGKKIALSPVYGHVPSPHA